MIKTDKYPVDLDALEKGDVITNEELERILGAKLGDAKFAFGMMNLQKKIYEKREFTASHRFDVGLCILTDVEASKYNDKAFHQKRRGMIQANQRMASVDVQNLSATARDDHNRKLLNQSRYISALRAPKKFAVEVQKQLDK